MEQYSAKERLALLQKQASNINFLNTIPASKYLQSGFSVLRMAGQYCDEKNFENAFVLYSKFAILVLEKLPNHIEYSTLPPRQITMVHKRVKMAIEIAEKLKLKLLKRFESDHESFLEEEEKKEQARLAEERRLCEQDTIRQMQELQRQKELNEILDKVHVDPPRETSIPLVDRSLKPSYDVLADKSSGMKSIYIPGDLIDAFGRISQHNTAINVETCSILGGTLVRDCFTVTHLLIPKQCGTADSCQTKQEEDIFEAQDSHNLITLGWIHTHPSQTCFMSSVDLHTHYSYQIMMPEAIAIVVSPRFSETKSFSITSEGIESLGKCKNPNLHHTHPSLPVLYTESTHMKVNSSISVKVLDLR